MNEINLKLNQEDLIIKAAELIFNSKYLVVLTGAGISTDSGIPDFRSPKDGLWTKITPEESKNIFKEPKIFWKIVKLVGPNLIKAKPNLSHRILANWQKDKKLKTVITQNIDGLHQEAGSNWVLELHGNAKEFSCIVCHSRFDAKKIIKSHKENEEHLPPSCPSCGGLLILNIVMFGQNIPELIWMESVSEAQKSDVFIVIGSSLVVYPANQLPIYAKKYGAKIIIINDSKTEFDEFSDIVLTGNSSIILKKIDKFIQKLNNKSDF